MQPAILLLEFDSIAIGIEAGDAMAKRSPLKTLHAGTVHPGRYLLLAGGEVADLEEAFDAACEVGHRSLRDQVFLPDVAPAVVAALTGARRRRYDDALGVFETATVPAVIRASDRAVKGSLIELLEIRLADGLGGKGYALFGGAVSDVEAAVTLAEESVQRADLLVARVVIAQLHREMAENLLAHAEFGSRVGRG